MFKHLISSITIASTLAVTAYAGTSDTPVTKQSSPVAGDYGSGFYIGLEGGFNATQDTYRFGKTNPWDVGNLSTSSNLGGFGGGKAGYTFGKGVFANSLVRPSVEVEAFYNGFTQNAVTSDGAIGRLNVDSSAYFSNALARFNLGRIQPYVGFGLGVYTGQADFNYTDGYHFGVGEKTSWAWQIVAGVDYYVTHSISVFTEYKFLNYMDAETSNFSTQNRLGQQLVTAGVSFHF